MTAKKAAKKAVKRTVSPQMQKLVIERDIAKARADLHELQVDPLTANYQKAAEDKLLEAYTLLQHVKTL